MRQTNQPKQAASENQFRALVCLKKFPVSSQSSSGFISQTANLCFTWSKHHRVAERTASSWIFTRVEFAHTCCSHSCYSKLLLLTDLISPIDQCESRKKSNFVFLQGLKKTNLWGEKIKSIFRVLQGRCANKEVNAAASAFFFLNFTVIAFVWAAKKTHQ